MLFVVGLAALALLVWQRRAISVTFTQAYQILFKASGTGAVSRGLHLKLGDTVSAKDYGAKGDGVTNDVPGIVAAIASLPASGGVVDARPLSSPTFGTTLTINKTVTLLLPAATIALGTNQILVTSGTANVALVGAVPYGSNGVGLAGGTYITYSGTGAAIVVGDSTADTFGFALRDVTVNISGVGAIALQLNRAQFYVLERPRLLGTSYTNNQILLDLEGYTNYSGGKIDAGLFSNGGTSIFFGQNANATTVLASSFRNTGGGTALAFTGAVGAGASGNAVIGSDVESFATVATFDRGFSNHMFGLRNESCTTLANATANSSDNVMWTGMLGSGPVVDAGARNSFIVTGFNQFGQTRWWWNNRTDATSSFNIQAGSTAEQHELISFLNKDGSTDWYINRALTHDLVLFDNASNRTRLGLYRNGTSDLSGSGTGPVSLNSAVNAGTGGVRFYSGGASPALVATVDGTGRLVQTGLTFATLGTPGNGSLTYCSDCIVAPVCAGGGTGAFAERVNGAWNCNGGGVSNSGTITLAAGTGTATVRSGANCVCSDTTAVAACKTSVSTTTLTVTGTGTDVIAYHCF